METTIQDLGLGCNFTQSKTLLWEVRAYIAANHCSVRIFCFLVALALVVASVLGMINIFSLVFDPFHYLVGVYNFFFALATGLLLIKDLKLSCQ